MRLLIIPLVIGLSACSMTPALVKPNSNLASVYPMVKPLDSRVKVVNLGWHSIFKEPRLQKLIELALANNHDLRLATLNVEAVQAQYGIQKAANLPSIDASASATRQRTLDSDSNASTPTTIQEQYGLNVGLNAFEIDLFGRVKSLSDAALDRYLASEQGQKAAQIALIASVADSYYAERLAYEQQQLAEQTLRDWQQSLDLARQLKSANQNSELDVAQAESQVATAEADLEARKRTVAQAHNALQLLIGTELPVNLPSAALLERSDITRYVPVGLPSELLTNRPDIMQAELNLQAANADIGAARAAFFPRISLTTNVGYASTQMAGLFGGENRVWSFSPQITIPIFQGGRLKSELKIAEIRKQSSIVQYEQAIHTAFREVADGLAGRATYDRQIQAQRRVVTSLEHRTKLSELRYKAGIDGRLELLDSQRQLYSAKQGLLELRRSELGNMIALYKAIGGGV